MFISSAQERRLATLKRHLQSPSLSQSQVLSSNETCGIIAYIGSQHAKNIIFDGLTILQNRGYDSAGITTYDSRNKKLCTTKFASRRTSDALKVMKESLDTHGENTIGIGHTRWATHGARTDVNAHPHHDQNDRLALVHNGVIENSQELKKELTEKGYTFRSETDTEVIVQLISYYLSQGDKSSSEVSPKSEDKKKVDGPISQLAEAVKKVQSRLEGTWGIVVFDKEDPGKLVAAKNGSPLLVGIGQGEMFVASEATAFSQFTKEYISLENLEVAVISMAGTSLDQRRIEKNPSSEQVSLSPAPFLHWTIKEIMEQPQALARTLNYGGRFLDDSQVKLGGLDLNPKLEKIENIIITGCGTSLHAGLYGAMVMRFLKAAQTIQVFDSSEVNESVFYPKNSVLIAISQSGETKDVHRAVVLSTELGVPTVSLVNSVGSLIARTTKCGLYLNAGREMAVASTKAFTAQVVGIILTAIWFAQVAKTEETKRRELVEALHRLPTNVGMTLNKVHGLCQQLATQHLLNCKNLFVLGKGLCYPIVLEGALKIKEITYTHAEGYPGGALKHGPFALIEPGTPIILLILNDVHYHLMKTTAEEVKSRHAFTIVITNLDPSEVQSFSNFTIPIPSNGPLTSLLAVIPLQILSYELAIARGIDPDTPRNLAKTITVD